MANENAYLIHTFEHRAYPLQPGALSIGRDSDNDVVVREVTVSRQHAEIYRDGDEYVLHGTGPTGVLVNDEPAQFPYVLHEGDRITIGTMTFVFTHSSLPLGVSIIDRNKNEHPETTVEMRRPTITNPILPTRGGFNFQETQHRMWLWIIIALLGIIVLFLRDVL